MTDPKQYENIAIEKMTRFCKLCEDYAKKNADKPIAIVSCEGACLRGEISRQAANIVSHKLIPEKTVRICLGGAFTKDSGQRDLVKNAEKVIVMEGCFIECASRMLKGVIPNLKTQIIITDTLCDFDKNLFGVDEMEDTKIKDISLGVAKKAVSQLG